MMPVDTNGQYTILVDEYRKSAESKFAHCAYKGLRIHALPGLHEFSFARIAEYVPTGGSVLDLAAGTGAMTMRLIDAGYKVTATDYVAENFHLHATVPFFTADLNAPFSIGRERIFDAIIASEIIEHLENPRHFARECFKMIKPGGHVILSTPNLDTAASVACFIRSGSFQWFSNVDYAHDGHISPLSQWQIGKCFAEAGFSTEWRGSFGSRTEWINGSPRLMVLTKLIDKLMSAPDALKNQIFVAVFRRPGSTAPVQSPALATETVGIKQ